MDEVGAGLTILLVEDHDDVREMTVDLLRQFGHQVFAVPNAESGLASLAERDFDVLMTDINLPGISGLSLAKAVAARFPTKPIIITSGDKGISETILLRELQLQVTVLLKPYEFETLRRALAKVTQLRELIHRS